MKQSKARFYPHLNMQDLFDRAERQPNGCIEWQRNRNYAGYPRITINYQPKFVHRYILELITGPQDHLFALHSCDNPPCINPTHLRWGTLQDNNHDSLNRKRRIMPRGEGSPNSKLTEKAVRAILASANDLETRKALAEEYQVSMSLIRAVMARQIWKHIN